MNLTLQRRNNLKIKEYRDAFVRSQITTGLPFQIRALRKQRGWSQKELAERAGMKQSRISTMEKPGAGKVTLETLRRLASAFDIGLAVRFVSFSDMLEWAESFRADSFTVTSFEQDSIGDFAVRGTVSPSGEARVRAFRDAAQKLFGPAGCEVSLSVNAEGSWIPQPVTTSSGGNELVANSVPTIVPSQAS